VIQIGIIDLHTSDVSEIKIFEFRIRNDKTLA